MKEFFWAHGLNTTGNKAELIARIQEADLQGEWNEVLRLEETLENTLMDSNELAAVRGENDALLQKLAEGRMLIAELKAAAREREAEIEQRNALHEANAQREALNRELSQIRK